MIEAGRFAKPTEPHLVSGGDKSFFRFAVSPEGTAAELRRLADAIESGRILVQKVQTGQVANVDEFYLQAIMLEFAEREDLPDNKTNSEEEKLVALYRDAREFPLAYGVKE